MDSFVLLSGSSNEPLAKKVAGQLGISLGKMEREEFANKEVRVRILEDVKDKTVFILQTTINPAERYIIELALIADAAKRNGATKIVAIMPWFGYSPQDKVFRKGEPLSAQVIIKMLEASEIDEFVVVDIHSQEVLEMFSKPADHLSAMDVFIDRFKGKLSDEWVSVALDNGALERARLFSEATNLPLVTFDKTRDRKTGIVTFHALKGDVEGKNVITFDDYVSTGGTMFKSAEFLKKEGAKKCYYCITHLIVPETLERLEKSSVDKLIISDSIKLDLGFRIQDSRLEVVSVDEVIGEFVRGCN